MEEKSRLICSKCLNRNAKFEWLNGDCLSFFCSDCGNQYISIKEYVMIIRKFNKNIDFSKCQNLFRQYICFKHKKKFSSFLVWSGELFCDECLNDCTEIHLEKITLNKSYMYRELINIFESIEKTFFKDLTNKINAMKKIFTGCTCLDEFIKSINLFDIVEENYIGDIRKSFYEESLILLSKIYSFISYEPNGTSRNFAIFLKEISKFNFSKINPNKVFSYFKKEFLIFQRKLLKKKFLKHSKVVVKKKVCCMRKFLFSLVPSFLGYLENEDKIIYKKGPTISISKFSSLKVVNVIKTFHEFFYLPQWEKGVVFEPNKIEIHILKNSRKVCIKKNDNAIPEHVHEIEPKIFLAFTRKKILKYRFDLWLKDENFVCDTYDYIFQTNSLKGAVSRSLGEMVILCVLKNAYFFDWNKMEMIEQVNLDFLATTVNVYLGHIFFSNFYGEYQIWSVKKDSIYPLKSGRDSNECDSNYYLKNYYIEKKKTRTTQTFHVFYFEDEIIEHLATLSFGTK